jgi:hypothetical protein
MSSCTVTYSPVGRDAFVCLLESDDGLSLEVSATLTDSTPSVRGHGAFRHNATVVQTTWAYGCHELAARRSRKPEIRNAYRKDAEKARKLAEAIAGFSLAATNQTHAGWCSCCFTFSEHREVDAWKVRPKVLLCDSCGAPTTPCAVPRCSNYADRGIGTVRIPRYCAEHRHDIPGFGKADQRLKRVEDYKAWLDYDKFNASKTTTITAVSLTGAALFAPAAFFAAPAIGGILGASALGGELTGAAAVSHGLAMLGGGALASGGLGMAGGTAVIVASGAGVGTYLGASTASAYAGTDKSFGIHKLMSGKGAPVFVISGFLTEGDQGWSDWEDLILARYDGRPIYRVAWGAKELRNLTDLFTSSTGLAATSRSLAMSAARATKAGATKVPYLGAAMIAAGFAANPWSVASARAEMTGGTLGVILGRLDQEGCVLVGHSLGGRVAAGAAQVLGSGSDLPRLESVHLLGAAIDAKGDWRALAASSTDGVFNYYSSRDKVLSVAYKTAQAGRSAAGSVGLSPKTAGIRNIDVSKSVGGHSDYVKSVQLR